MLSRPILALLLLIGSTGYLRSQSPDLGSRNEGEEIASPAERTAILDRLAKTYYDLRGHSFTAADCRIHSSFIDEVDTTLAAALPETSGALKQLRRMTMKLHFSLLEKPSFTSTGEVRTGDEQTDQLIAYMIPWSSRMLTYGVNSWRIFADGEVTAPAGPMLMTYRLFRAGAGYRIQTLAGSEMILDSAMRLVSYSTRSSKGTVTSKTYFRETPGGLVLERIVASIPEMQADMDVTLQFSEVEGVLLPSKVVALFDSRAPQPDGSKLGKMSFTFLLSGYHIVKG